MLMEMTAGALTACMFLFQLADRMHSLLNYEPPEFRESGIVTEQGDVYSFGVVMLEILTGRKPYDSSLPRAEQHLVRWANSQLHDIESLSRMVDPSIQGQCSEKALSRFADIISGCIRVIDVYFLHSYWNCICKHTSITHAHVPMLYILCTKRFEY
jgi:serine/threonine protein kinase